jgi:hypothetical protein
MKYSMQQAFDKMSEHLLSMNGRSIDPYLDSCKYRSPNGQKCVVGCLIPDKMYEPDMDFSEDKDTSIKGVWERFPQVKELVKYDNESEMVDFLIDFQLLHDLNTNWNNSKFINIEALQELAEDYKLEFNHEI